MQVVITGAAGFIGRKLIDRLVQRKHLTDANGVERPLTELVLFDVTPAAAPPVEGIAVSVVTGDIGDPATVADLIGGAPASIYHLAAVVSGAAEADFELGMRVNLDGTRALLEACRRLPAPPRFVFSSSVAVFGGDMPAVIQDDTAPTPQSSYGIQKAIGELLVNDYSRKGFVDGRSLRFPTIVVRPGKPNPAASSFASSIVREPLQGDGAVCPVAPEMRLWLSSPRRVIDALVHAHDLPAGRLASNRIVTLPGLTATVREMVDALARIAGEEVTRRIEWRRDERIERIVGGWPGRFDPIRALALGFRADPDVETIIRAFIEDDLHNPSRRHS